MAAGAATAHPNATATRIINLRINSLLPAGRRTPWRSPH
jgi:hypothetical protein